MAPADDEHRFTVTEMHEFTDLMKAVWDARIKRICYIDGMNIAIRDSLPIPVSFDLFIERGIGRYELNVLQLCLDAARDVPDAFAFLLCPRGPLRRRLQSQLGPDFELRDISAFMSLPGSEDQRGHLDNADASSRDYVTIFFAPEDITSKLGPTQFFRGTYQLDPKARDAFCRKLNKQKSDSRGAETVLLKQGQWLAFSMLTVHRGLKNVDKCMRILGSAMWARKGAPDLHQNRKLRPLPTPSLPKSRRLRSAFGYEDL